jgi:heat-inducible transcriptional repressor
MPTNRRVPRSDVPEPPALDARKAAILEAVVSEYIGTAQPVGSQHVADASGVKVSSATVRSEMAALEHEGYLVQPHTSAGRIPTDKGYRFFVDHLTEPGVLGPAQRQKVRRFFDDVHGEMEGLLQQTSGLLSDLTSYAAVVVAPRHETAPIRSAQLVALGQHLALIVIVLADGTVEKRAVELDDEPSAEALSSVSGHLARHLEGHRLSERTAVPRIGDPRLDPLVDTLNHALADLTAPAESEHVFVGGSSRVAMAFDAVETVRAVLATLERQMVVVSLLRDVLDQGLSVAIGTEHGYQPLASCAVIVAPLNVGGHEDGAIGLLGPTRMNYPQALAAAHVVGERLGERLGDSLGTTPEDHGATARQRPRRGTRGGR